MAPRYQEGVVSSQRLGIPEGYREARISVVFFLLLTVPLLLLVVFVSPLGGIYGFLTTNLVFFAIFLVLLGGFLATRPALTNAIRVKAQAPLRFLPSRLMPLFYVASGMLLLAGVMPLLEVVLTSSSTIAQTPGLARQFWFVTVIGGLAGLIHAFVGIFYPFGVTLDERGIVWRSHLGRPRFVSWESLEKVELGKKGKTKVVYLHSSDEGICTIIPMTLGSDPIVIAETIDYFRRNPNDRETLNDPYAALALVIDFAPAR